MKLQTLAHAVLAALPVAPASAGTLRGSDHADPAETQDDEQHRRIQAKRDLLRAGHHPFRLFEDGVEPGYRGLEEPDVAEWGEHLLRGGGGPDDEGESDLAPDTRIIGGGNAKGNYKWHCSMEDHIGPFCGASLISESCVVTAA